MWRESNAVPLPSDMSALQNYAKNSRSKSGSATKRFKSSFGSLLCKQHQQQQQTVSLDYCCYMKIAMYERRRKGSFGQF